MAAREVSAEEKVDCCGKKEKGGGGGGFSCTWGHRGNGIGGRKQLWPDWKTGRGHSPGLNVLQGAQASELSFHHDGKTAAQRLALLHAEKRQRGLKVRLEAFEHTVISHGRCQSKRFI